MKKIVFFSLIFVGILSFLSSCKTEEEVKDLGWFTVDDVKYTINKGVVKGYKSTNPDNTNNYVFTFTSENDDTSRTVNLAISFPYNDASINGIYLLNGTSKQLDSWLSHYAETYGKHTDTYNNLTAGKCTVTRMDEKTFKVNFDFKPAAGQKIVGEFLAEAEVTENTY